MKTTSYSIIFAAVCVLLFTFNHSNSVKAESGQAYEVGTDNLNVRIAPDSNAEIAGTLNSGDRVNAFKEEHGWIATYYDGEEVWVASQYLYEKDSGEEDQATTTNTTSNEDNSSNNATNSSNQSLAGYNIMLDPGHGGKDPGALSIHADKEKDLILDYTNVIAEKLRSEGATVLLTRSNDSYVSLEDRVRISDAYWTDAFISLHFNGFTSSDSNGISTHYYENRADYELAQHIQSSLEIHTDLKNRGVRQDNYHVLRENNSRAVLVELGFLSNPYDMEVIQNSNHSSEVAHAISQGLINYFNE